MNFPKDKEVNIMVSVDELKNIAKDYKAKVDLINGIKEEDIEDTVDRAEFRKQISLIKGYDERIVELSKEMDSVKETYSTFMLNLDKKVEISKVIHDNSRAYVHLITLAYKYETDKLMATFPDVDKVIEASLKSDKNLKRDTLEATKDSIDILDVIDRLKSEESIYSESEEGRRLLNRMKEIAKQVNVLQAMKSTAVEKLDGI